MACARRTAAANQPSFELGSRKWSVPFPNTSSSKPLPRRWARIARATPSDVPDVGSCYRMFEGSVTMHGLGWDPWVRTILPAEVAAIRDDLCAIDEDQVRTWASTWRSRHGVNDDDELHYVLDYLTRAQEFVESLAADGRGMVYLIG